MPEERLELRVGDFSMPLMATEKGPALDQDEYEVSRPLVSLMELALGGYIPNFVSGLKAGENVGFEGVKAERPSPRYDVERGALWWRRKTGRAAGDDVYVVRAGYAPLGVVVPRSALLLIYEELKRVKEQWRVEQERISAEHAQRPAPEPPPVVVPTYSREDLGLSNPGTLPEQLFRWEPATDVPGEGEHELLESLENRARDLEDADPEPRSVERAAAASARRRFLLLDLSHYGLFERSRRKEKREWIERWQFTTSLGYYDAALRLLDYLESPERERIFQEPPSPHTVEGAWVSLDWFRLNQPTRENLTPFEWLGTCEFMLRWARPGPFGEGKAFAKIRGNWYCLDWRTDDGSTPALIAATPC